MTLKFLYEFEIESSRREKEREEKKYAKFAYCSDYFKSNCSLCDKMDYKCETKKEVLDEITIETQKKPNLNI